MRLIDIFYDFTNYDANSNNGEDNEKGVRFERRCCKIFKSYIIIRFTYTFAIIVFCIKDSEAI